MTKLAAIVQLHAQGKLQEAEQGYRALIQQGSMLAPVHNNLAAICIARGRTGEAVDLLNKAIQLDPAFRDAYRNLGLVLKSEGKLDEALAAFRKASELKPNDAQSLGDLAAALKDHGDLDEALLCCRRLVEIEPGNYPAHQAIAALLYDRRAFDEAIIFLERALALKPESAAAHSNLGIALKDQGRLEEAAARFRRALELKPDFEVAYSALIYTLSFGQLESQEEILRISRGFEAAICPPARDKIERRPIPSGRKIRVGFISAEIGSHAVSYFLESYLRNRDRQKIEIVLYPTKHWQHSKRTELIGLADKARDLSATPDDKAHAQIREDGIDILIDTTSHMTGGRLPLLARRCAPVQCHYIGFHGSTGIGAVDYFIGDGEITPHEFDSHFSEKIIRLPRLWVAYTPPADAPAVEQWSPDDAIVFGSFNNIMKVREATLSLWAEAMLAVPEARLIVKDWAAASGHSKSRLEAFLEARGIRRDRIELIGHVADWNAHMQLYNRVDVALDTYPLNGGTTSFDALFMGTPLVAVRGDWMGGRMSSAMLKALGRHEWIAENPKDFARIVAALAADRTQLKAYKKTLRGEVLNSPLCDGRSLTGALEAAFDRMVIDYNAAL